MESITAHLEDHQFTIDKRDLIADLYFIGRRDCDEDFHSTGETEADYFHFTNVGELVDKEHYYIADNDLMIKIEEHFDESLQKQILREYGN